MKTLRKLVLLASMMVSGCATLPKITEIDMHEKFLNYQKCPVTTMIPIKWGDKVYIQKAWDLDGDKDADVAEMYLMPNPLPVFYAFDINDNNVYETSEILFDMKMDGLNGNETRFDKYLAEQAKNKKKQLSSAKNQI